MSSEAPGADADKVDLQPSAVALIDVLGFKSLEVGSAAKAMMTARQMIRELTTWMNEQNWQHIHTLGGLPKVTTSWFSDTICIVAQPTTKPLLPPTEQEMKPALLAVVAMSVGYLLRQAATADVPLTFRSVVTVGEMAVIDDDIYVGAPIAEAAALYEQADGAFVWLSPAADELRLPRLQGTNHRALIGYEVPLKDGRTIYTKVINPFIDMSPRALPGTDVRAGIVKAMRSDRVDVVIKRQNTIDFLEYVADTEPKLMRSGPEGGG